MAVDCGDGHGPTPVNDLIADANIVLCMAGYAPGNDADVADIRKLQEDAKDCLDAVNSNAAGVKFYVSKPGPCAFTPVPCVLP